MGEGIPPQDLLRPGGRRARWLLRDVAVQRQSAVQRATKIGILERGPSLGLVELHLYIFCWLHGALVVMLRLIRVNLLAVWRFVCRNSGEN